MHDKLKYFLSFFYSTTVQVNRYCVSDLNCNIIDINFIRVN